ncbi:MAG: phosphocholine cytidylyltransferase family protein [Candidatus Aenigmarchaeota archaeon]|nr:phosphocholine cytidylyltransferase family protein [Candidatus Aenigmarchaeota archaeon]
MKALILAAGVGKRLKPITDHIPKTLIKIEDKPILGHILTNIQKCGIKDVLIVTGYRDDLIHEYVGNGSKWGLNVSYCHNKRYKNTENIYSVQVAGKGLDGDEFILINADDLFSPFILWKLMEAPGDIVLAVENKGTVGTEEMKVSTDENGRITAVSKELEPSESYGEDIGIIKFSKEGGRAFLDTIKNIIKRRGHHFYFQEAINDLSTKEYPVTYVNVGNEPWIEIDDHFDLKWAKTPIIHMIKERLKAMGKRISSIRRKSK